MGKGTTGRIVTAVAALVSAAVLVLVVFAVMPTQGGSSAGGEPVVSQITDATSGDGSGSSETAPSEASSDGATTDGGATTGDGATSDGSFDGEVSGGTGDAPHVDYEPGVALIQVKEGVTAEQVDAVLASTPGVATTDVSPDEVASGLVKVELAAGTSVSDAVSSLEKSPDVVDGAQPNYAYYVMDDTSGGGTVTLEEALSPTNSIPQSTDVTDTYAKKSASDVFHWQLDDRSGLGVQAYTAWDSAKCDKNVSVAVIDSGCTVGHEDLSANIVATYDSVANDGSTDVTDAFGNSSLGAYGHGTHVAGIISARANNSTGVAGVSYNAGLVIIRALSSDGVFWTDGLYNAYHYLLSTSATDYDADGTKESVAEELNVRVINMSLGGGGECTSDDVVLQEVDKAYAAGIVTVCASGNQDTANNLYVPFADYPADYPTCVGVMNLARTTVSLNNYTVDLASSSNYNLSGSRAKNISAPGQRIYSTYPTGYKYMSGTSMASPVVSAVVALEFAANPELTAGQAKSVLYDSAYDLGTSGWDERYGYGEADAAAAVAAADVTISGPESLLVSETDSYSIDALTGSWAWSSSDSSILSINASTGAARGVASGTATVTATETSGTAMGNGDGSARSISMQVTVYSASISGQDAVALGGTASYSLSASPSTGVWYWSSSDTSIASVGGTSGVLTGKAAGTITLKASLSTNPDVYVTKQVTIKPKPATWGLTLSTTSLLVGKTATITFSVVEGATSYVLEVSDPSLASLNVGSGTATLTALKVGTVTVRLVDASGTVQQSQDITITGTIDISSAKVSVSPSTMSYTGSALEPDVTVENDGVTLVKNQNYTVSYADNVTRGTATVTVQGMVDASGVGYTGSASATFSVTPVAKRLAGSTALGTMAAIEDEGNFSTGGVAVVATKDGYWDALAAAGLAGLSGGSVLLTDSSSLSSEAASQLSSLKPTMVYVAGGTAAVSDGVARQIATAAGISSSKVVRLGGANAIGTAELIYQAGTGWSKTCVVATSNSFQDALSIAPYAYSMHAPIFLAQSGVNVLSSGTLAAIKEGGFTNVVIVGGPAAVSDVVFTQLSTIGVGNGSTTNNAQVSRLWGNNAYDTSLAIANWELINGLSAREVSVATGDGYWDALTGASLSGHNGTILVLASDSNQACIDGFIAPHASSISRIYAYGGTAVVSDSTFSRLRSLIGA